jgi:hypothetical protein
LVSECIQLTFPNYPIRLGWAAVELAG